MPRNTQSGLHAACCCTLSPPLPPPPLLLTPRAPVRSVCALCRGAPQQLRAALLHHARHVVRDPPSSLQRRFFCAKQHSARSAQQPGCSRFLRSRLSSPACRPCPSLLRPGVCSEQGPNSCNSTANPTPCSVALGLCSSGMAGASSNDRARSLHNSPLPLYTFTCPTDLQAGALPSGGSALCYDTTEHCEDANNACGPAWPCEEDFDVCTTVSAPSSLADVHCTVRSSSHSRPPRSAARRACPAARALRTRCCATSTSPTTPPPTARASRASQTRCRAPPAPTRAGRTPPASSTPPAARTASWATCARCRGRRRMPSCARRTSRMAACPTAPAGSATPPSRSASTGQTSARRTTRACSPTPRVRPVLCAPLFHSLFDSKRPTNPALDAANSASTHPPAHSCRLAAQTITGSATWQCQTGLCPTAQARLARLLTHAAPTPRDSP